jgi:nitrate reductase NapD
MSMHTRPQAGQYSIAGVVVRSRAVDLPQVAARLARFPGVDVHHIEVSTGRVVITIEADQQDHDEAQLERVRREPGVLSAELIYHYVEPPVPDVGQPDRSNQGAL